MSLFVAMYLLLVGATIAAVALARRDRGHAPFAAFLVVMLAKSVARTVIAPHLPDTLGPPLTGWTRALFHAEQALFLLGPAALAACALVTCAKVRSRWPGWLAAAGWFWIAVTTMVAFSYPSLRGDPLRKAYLLVELLALFVCIGACALWLRRREPPSVSQLCVALCVGVELSLVLVGPWGRGLFSTWNLAQLGYSMLYVTLIVLQTGALCLRKTKRS